ncbi:hypothetical protein PM082_007092 [Marasmius tenuissimus]|nr:hypothetical protein PM082_007092 [Marasmius tenuissimus]
MTKILLERSQQKPFTIRVDTPKAQENISLATPFLQNLITRASDLQLSCFIRRNRDMLRGLSFPFLRTLTLVNDNYFGCPGALMAAPELTSVFVEGTGGLLTETIFPRRLLKWKPWSDIRMSQSVSSKLSNSNFEAFDEDDEAAKAGVEQFCRSVGSRWGSLNAQLSFTLPAAKHEAGREDIECDGGVVKKRGSETVITIPREKGHSV